MENNQTEVQPTVSPVPYRCVTRIDSARDYKQLAAPMFEPEVFRKQMYRIEESRANFLWPKKIDNMTLFFRKYDLIWPNKNITEL